MGWRAGPGGVGPGFQLIITLQDSWRPPEDPGPWFMNSFRATQLKPVDLSVIKTNLLLSGAVPKLMNIYTNVSKVMKCC